MPDYKKKPASMAECIGPSCQGCSSGNCYAEGGSVGSWTKREDNEKGINHSAAYGKPGTSNAGMHVRAANGEGLQEGEKEDSYDAAKKNIRSSMKSMKSMPKPNLYADGGEVSEGEDQFGDDHEIHGMLGDELMGAFEAKDKKRIMESLEAIVLSCMNKEHHDDV